MSAPQPTFREYGFQAVGERLAVMLSHADGVRQAEDIEALHDMRVASRRLRAALSLFGDVFPARQFRRFDAEVKAITDALGEARDLDVMIEALEKLERTMDEGERSGLDSFLARKRARRATLQNSVVSALDRLGKVDLTRRLADMARPPARVSPPPADAPTPAPQTVEA